MSDNVERLHFFAVDGGCDAYADHEPDEHGDYVKYEDHKAIAARLTAERDEAREALSTCVQFADSIAEIADIDMEETVLTVRVMPSGMVVGQKAWAQVQDEAKAILARIDHPKAEERT